MEYETILLSVEDELATLTMNRPAKLNAQNGRMGREIADVCSRHEELGIRGMVVTGDRRAFSAGADLKEGAYDEEPGPGWLEAVNWLAALPFPTIAAIEGWCLGGGLLTAIACDLRVAASDARLGAPEILRGVYFGTTGTWRMPRIIGSARTKELFYLGDHLDVATAERWGLVNWVVSPGEALSKAREIAQRLASGPTVALAAIKELVDASYDQTLEEAIAYEASQGGRVSSSEDSIEGVQAFVERRPPVFKGR